MAALTELHGKIRGGRAVPGLFRGAFSAMRPTLPQLLVVCAAFLTLSLVSYFYVSNIMKRQVDLYSGSEMEVHRIRMRSLLNAHESALLHAAASVAFESSRGASPEELQELLRSLSQVFSTQPEMEGIFVSVYGYIRGNYLDATSWIPGEFFYPATAPWLRGALLTKGIFHTRPYIDPRTGDAVAAVSTVVYDSDGGPLGVLAIDYFLNPIIDRVRSYRIAESGWGFLLDDSFTILTCPDQAYIGRKLSEYPGFGPLASELMGQAGGPRSDAGYAPQPQPQDGEGAAAYTPPPAGGDRPGGRGEGAGDAPSPAAGGAAAPPAGAPGRGEPPPRPAAGPPADGAPGEQGALGSGGVLVKSLELAGSNNIVFFSTLENGWHIGIVSPYRYYYSEVFRLFPVISLLGAALALLVCAILVRMSQAKTRSEEESLQKSSFLARMSHEIRTPLNAVLGMCELARRSLGKPEAAEYLAGIRRAGGDLLTIINDILDFSRISARSSEFNVAPYSTSSMLCDALVFLKIRMEGNHVGFKAAASPSLPSRLLGDEVRVRQVLTNLLSNAAKYTRRGSISLDVGCSEEAQGRVRLSFRVADTGIGIRREDMDSLFGEFVRLEQGGVRHIEGTGLGLSITRSLCRAMGGDVSVESEYGKGSVFTAEVVQGVADPTPMGSLEEEARPGEEWSPDRPDAAPFTAPGFRVLIVDDIETNLLVAKGLLEPYGMDVEVSLIPSQAVELCESVPFDLLFIDHMMPEMDGAQTMERIRGLGERWKSVPIVVLTAAVMAGMKEMFLSKGFDAFLGKPIVFSELALILDRFVPQSRRVAPSEARAAGSSTRAGEGISIQGIDAISGLRRMGGKRADYIKALTVFRRDLEERSQALGAVEQGGLEAFRIQVHAVKSAAANVGALGLSEEAALLEEASSRGDLAGVRTRLPRLTARLASITAAIAGALRRESETAAPPAHDPPPAAGPAPAPAGAPAAPAGTPAAPAAGDYGRSPALGNGDGAPLPPDGGPADPGAPEAAKPVAQAGAPAGGNGGGPGVFPRLNVERGLLLDLRQALAKRDVREIDRLLEGIGSAATDPGTREAVEQISTRVLMADYDEAEFLVAKSIG